MKRNILIIIVFVFSFNLYCQTIKPSIDHYLSGRIFWKGQDICDTSDNGSKYCFPIGLWTYWHENGKKMLELNHRIIKPKLYTNTLYLSMWLPDGTQILKDGNGTYYEDEPHGGGDRDSLVYQITDSIKHGPCKRYRLYKESSYFLVETGQYNRNKKDGMFKFRDTVRYLIENETVYSNDEETSNYKLLHKNLLVKEAGRKVNGLKEGVCKFYDDKGVLIKEVNYKNGAEYGDYKEFYPNGKIKVQGQYTHTKGLVKVTSFDPDGSEHISKEPSDMIPAKDGEWKYFDHTGKVIKTKKY